MLNNYLKTALRNLRRHRGYALINIFGLALSMSVCLLILLLVQDQMSYDRFHPHADRIYRVIADRIRLDGGTSDMAATPAFLGPQIEQDGPGVAETVRLGQIRTNVVYGGKGLYAEGIYAEPSFFDLFNFEVLSGSRTEGLTGPYKVMLSEEMAAKTFGAADPLGQVITLEGAGDFTVTGIVHTEGVKSHLKFDVLASFATLEAFADGRERLADEKAFWWFSNYLLLEEGASPAPLQAYLDQVSSRFDGVNESKGWRLKLQPLTGITLGPMLANEISSYSLPRVMVLFLIGIALVVMLAAGFNYIGLTIARSLQRAREVGIRKSVGAHRGQIIGQFLAESVVMAVAALLLAYVMLILLLPGFNSMSVIRHFRVELGASALYDVRIAAAFLLFSITVGVLAGLYPALSLSRFNPVLVLKGAGLGRGHSRLLLRKVLVTAQLVFSLLFIISGVLIYRQLDYMINFDYGFQSADMIDLELQGASYPMLRDELLRHPDILNVTATSTPPASGSIHGGRVFGSGADSLDVITYSVDAHFLSGMGLELQAGRNFTAGRTEEGIIINEVAARRLGFDAPQAAVGQVLAVNDKSEHLPILGVVENYQFNILLEPVTPMMLVQTPEEFRHALIRIHPHTGQQVASQVEEIWKRLDPVHPVKYTFYDTQLRYENEGAQAFRDIIKVVGLAAFIALAIACLGLLSMAAYHAELRRKEVGVRKVLGATVPGVVWLLSREFLLLIPVALLFAIPLAWFGNNLWLQQIANRIPIGPAVFLAGTALLLVVALLAIGTQTFRAAASNPVDSLRYE